MIMHLNHFAEVWASWMWAMAWQTAVLVAIVWALDLLVRRWLWPQVRYALWLLVLVKLLLPPGFSSPASVTQPLAELPRRVQLAAPTEKIPLAAPMAREDMPAFKDNPALPETIPSSMQNLANTPVQSEVSAPPAKTRTTAEKESHPIVFTMVTWKVYLMIGWILGVWILGGWLMIKLQDLARTARNNDPSVKPPWLDDLLNECRQRLNLKRPPAVVFTRSVRSPAVYGIVRPVLLMPADRAASIARQDAEHILLHELAHIKRGDLSVHALFMTLQIFYWFHPLLWLVRRQLQHLRELCCDATVARLLRENTPQYRQTLLETARALLAEKTEPGMGLLGLFEDANRLRTRLSWLEKNTWKHRPLQIASILAVVTVMLACVLPMAKAKNDSQTQPEKTEDTYIATLSNGITVELVGVCEHPSEGKSWWRPDGTPLEGTILKLGEITEQIPKGYCQYGFAAKIHGLEKPIFYWIIPQGQEIQFIRAVTDSSGNPVDNMAAAVAALPAEKKHTALRIGIAAKAWQTIATVKPNSAVDIGFYGKAEYTIEQPVIDPQDASGRSSIVEMTHTFPRNQYATRLVAFTKSGETVESHGTGTGGKTLNRIRYWYRVPLGQIREFQFQIRPYEYAAFENVSLRPGEKTSVQIEVEGKNQEPAVRQADWLDRWQEKANGYYDRLAEAYRAQDWQGVKAKAEQLNST